MTEFYLIELLIQNLSYRKTYINFFLILLMFFLILVLISFLSDIFNYLFKKKALIKRLVNKEARLISLKKRYLDGEINAKEYKIKTMRILKS